jgi:hypothetical protein
VAAKKWKYLLALEELLKEYRWAREAQGKKLLLSGLLVFPKIAIPNPTKLLG